MSHPLENPGRSAADDNRLGTLDLLRGLALLGMILVHGQMMLSTTPETDPTRWLTDLLFAGKSRALFALLFGAGFALLLQRTEAKQLPVVPVFLRRLAVLYGLGFLVEALTRFQILREYALWGVALLFLRNQPTRTLLIAAALSAAAFSIRDLSDSGWDLAVNGRETAVAGEIARQEAWMAAQAKIEAELADPRYLQVVGHRIGRMLREIPSLQTFTPGTTLAFFILGFLSTRHRLLTEDQRHRRLLGFITAAGAVSWATAHWLLPLIPADLITPRIGHRLQTGLGLISEQFLVFTWTGTIILVLSWRPTLSRVMSPLTWAGRLPLTNYVVQAVLIDLACAPYGLHLRLSPPSLLLLSSGLFVTMALGSKAWLAHFRYGPVEWSWRCLTYWRWQPFKKPDRNISDALTG